MSNRGPSLAEPPWFSNLAQLQPAPVSWRDLVRVPLSIVSPLALGVALHAWAAVADGLAIGVFASIGALVGAIAPQRGPARERLARTLAGVVLGAAGLLTGRLAAHDGWEPVVVVAGLSGIAALVSAVSANVSFGMLQFLSYIAVGSGLVTSLPVDQCVALFAAGGAWATALTLLDAKTDPVDPDRQVVSNVLVAMGQLLVQSGKGEDQSVRMDVTAAYNQATDQIALSRGRAPGRSARLLALAGILNSTSMLADGGVALYRVRATADPADVEALAALAGAVRTGARPVGAPPPERHGGSPAERSIRQGVRLLWMVVDGDQEPGAVAPGGGRRWRTRAAELVSETVASPASRLFALRLGLCMAIAEIVRQNLPYRHPYWVLLTVAIVIKPDFGSVFARGAQRLAGTVVGVVIGAGLLALVPHNGWMLLPLVAVTAAMPWASAANYGLSVVALTPAVVILLDLGVRGGSTVLTTRLADTAVGCGIVLVFGYLLWPQTWRSSTADSLQRALAALDEFLALAFIGDPERRRRARRETYRSLSGVQAELQRQLSEPPPLSTRAAAWWPVIVQIERAADAVIGAAVAVDAGKPVPGPEQVGAVRRSIGQLLAGTGPCADLTPLVAGGVLEPVAREVETACRLLRQGRSPTSSPGS